MLYAILICTDEACGEEFEAWGEPDELDALDCESCDCALQPLAFCEMLHRLGHAAPAADAVRAVASRREPRSAGAYAA